MKYHLGLNHLHMADFPLSGRSTIWQAVNHFLIPYQACAWGTPMGFYRYSDINTSIGFRCAPQFASFIFEAQLLLRVSSLNRQRAFCLKSPAEEAQCKSSFRYWQYLDEDPVIQDNSRMLFLYCLSMIFYLQWKMMLKVWRSASSPLQTAVCAWCWDCQPAKLSESKFNYSTMIYDQSLQHVPLTLPKRNRYGMIWVGLKIQYPKVLKSHWSITFHDHLPC